MSKIDRENLTNFQTFHASENTQVDSDLASYGPLSELEWSSLTPTGRELGHGCQGIVQEMLFMGRKVAVKIFKAKKRVKELMNVEW